MTNRDSLRLYALLFRYCELLEEQLFNGIASIYENYPQTIREFPIEMPMLIEGFRDYQTQIDIYEKQKYLRPQNQALTHANMRGFAKQMHRPRNKLK